VLYIDFEDDEGGVVGRLLALGADPAWIRARFCYLRPTIALNAPIHAADLSEVISNHRPTLAVIDGITEAMTIHGFNPNDNKDIATFGRSLPRPLANCGLATVCLDHVAKNPDGRGCYAIGGVHKLNGIDGAAFILENREPFGIDLTGRSAMLSPRTGPASCVSTGIAARTVSTTSVTSSWHPTIGATASLRSSHRRNAPARLNPPT
jgi:AAA domain